jgi:hypothetical protein
MGAERALRYNPCRKDGWHVARGVLGGGADLAVCRQVAQEGRDLRLAEFLGMPFPMVQDVAPYPIQVGLLGPKAEIRHADRSPDSLEGPGCPRFRRSAAGS